MSMTSYGATSDSKPFVTGLAGSGTVELEITCDPGAKSVTFADPTLYR